MNVLIIDDQENVVNGLVRGVNWKELRIANVWTANHACRAKDVMQKQKVDIMLCDIEMPGEDGLSLFRWAKEYDSRIECIFLTAHADFEFAKEALQLGSFDYILQPAPYEEVEEAIRKVCTRILSKTEQLKYSSYGKEFYENKDLLLEGFLKDWLAGGETAVDSVLKNLHKFGISLTMDTEVCYCIFHVIRWEGETEKLESSLFKYAVSNILTELFSKYRVEVLQAPLEKDLYALLFYQEAGEKILKSEMKMELGKFLSMCRSFYGGIAACYLGTFCGIEELEAEIRNTRGLWKDNVALRDGIFAGNRYGSAEPQDMDWMKNWPQELAGGREEEVRRQALQFLSRHGLNARILKQFYLEFMQAVSAACEQIGISNYRIFEEKESFEKSLQAYESVTAMENLIIQVTDYFGEHARKDDSNYVETVIQYIHCNIEKDIRRGELAQLVNLNEDYLSRIFKKEKEISLKEYIILEKMRTAQNLLLNTNFSISMIGAKVGFVNFSHFSQTYKKVMGKTPAEERS